MVVENERLSQKAFAEVLGVSQATVSGWLNKAGPGSARRRKRSQFSDTPKPEHLWRIAKMYGVSIDWLFFGDEVPMDRRDRAQIGDLIPTLRQKLLEALEERDRIQVKPPAWPQIRGRRVRARPAAKEAALGSAQKLWDSLVEYYAELAVTIELNQSNLDYSVQVATLRYIAQDTSGRVFDVQPIQFHRAGIPPPNTPAQPARRITSAQAAAALEALGEWPNPG